MQRPLVISLALASGCQLYFGTEHAAPVPDAAVAIDAPRDRCVEANDAGTCRVLELPLPDVSAATSSTLFPVLAERTDHWFTPELWWWDRAAGLSSGSIVGDALVVDGTNAIVRSYTHGIGVPDSYPAVMSCTLGGQCGRVYTYTELGITPWLLGAYGGQLYILDLNGDSVRTCAESDCTTITTVATGIARCGWSTTGYVSCVGGVFGAVDDAGIYVLSAGHLYVIPFGQSATEIAMPGDGVKYFAVVADAIYWATAAGDIYSCPKIAAACTPSLRFSVSEGITGFHVDTTTMFWLTNAGDVMSCPRDGCASPRHLYSCGQRAPDPADTYRWIPDAYRLTGDASYVFCVHPAPPPADGRWGASDVLQIAK